MSKSHKTSIPPDALARQDMLSRVCRVDHTETDSLETASEPSTPALNETTDRSSEDANRTPNNGPREE